MVSVGLYLNIVIPMAWARLSAKDASRAIF